MMLLFLLVAAMIASAQDQPTVVFGTNVVVSGGLEGSVYNISKRSTKIPDLKKAKPQVTIYASSLNIPTRDFQEGFPGVTKRFEWFAIDYTGRFWIEKPGVYSFALTSDDGSRLLIDDRLVVDNDGIHASATKFGDVELSGGIHRIHVEYFQGPRFAVTLVLKVAGPGEDLRVFSTDEFKPPANPADWKFPPP